MSETVLTVGDLVRLGARRSPDRVAARMRGGPAVTYAELDRRTNQLANALLARGLEPGDRVAAWMEDSLEYVELYLAVAKAGLVIVPVNARFVPGEAIHIIVDSGARALFWTEGLTERVAELDLGSDHLLVSTVPEGGRESAYEAVLAAGADSPPPAPRGGDLYIIGYTSGTTGTPKGALLTHRSVLAIARIHASAYRLPLFSVGALTGSMSFVATVPAHHIAHLYMGGTIVVMGRWDVESLLRTLADERATFTYVPTPLIVEFAEAAARDRTSWASVDTFLHSGSAADPEKLGVLCDVIGDRFVEGLGMTENSGGLVTATTRADIADLSRRERALRSVGRAAVESVVEVVDDAGSPLPHDGTTVGELIARTPALMSGYWNLPEATAAVLRDGWYHSGDLATMDGEGYVFLNDRRTDLIISGGINVYPTEVERCIAAVPGVLECAVVGVPHDRWGEGVVAVVVADAAVPVTSEGVLEHCGKHQASYKKPLRVLFWPELPRTTSMKVKRSAVRDRVAAELSA
jgi:fatty-acyl-CoA synthase